MTSRDKHWSEVEERGSILGLKLLLWVYRLLGRRLLWIALFPVVLFMYLSGSKARNASSQFFTYAHQTESKVPAPTWFNGLKHFCQFADSAFDKLDAWLGQITQAQISYNDADLFPSLVEKRQGAIFIGSHLGNLEVCRALSHEKYTTTINVLVFTSNAVKFNEILQSITPDVSVNMIQVEHMSPTLAISLKEKIDQGEMIVIVGDRTSVTTAGRVEYIPFLGEPAPFSQGPFILASLLSCPVYWFFCLKEKQGFKIIIEHVADNILLPRKQRAQVLNEFISAYVNRLEYYALRYPYQWFNFFNFWQKDDTVARRVDKEV